MEAELTGSLERPPTLRSPAPVAGIWGRVLRAIGDVASQREGTGPGAEELSLIRSMGGGDGDAATEIYRRYSERIFRFICRRLEQTEDAEEITLDTFLAGIDMASTFRGNSSVFVWLCGISKLKIIDFHRRQTSAKRSPRGAQSSLDQADEVVFHVHFGRSSIEEVLDRILASQVVDAALSRLTADEREALLLRYVEDLPIREIALLMKRSEAAVDSLLARAKAKPRKFLLRALGKETVHD